MPIPAEALSLPWVLASASPRRVEILGRFGRPFEIAPAHLDEDTLTVPDPRETAERLALAKARAIGLQHPACLIIGGDTVVALAQDGQDRQLGKPATPEDAISMLLTLSGKTHRVISGLSFVWPWGEVVASEVAEVTFRQLEQSEIERYVATGEPFDKAGGYAIQGGAASFVSHFNGHIDCVVGLPTVLFAKLTGLRP